MNLPAQEYRRTRIVIPEKLHQGLDRLVYAMVGTIQRRRGQARYLEAEAAQADAQSRAIAARYDVRRAEAKLRKAIGLGE